MVQIKFLFALLAVMTILVLAADMASAYDCLSGKYSGPCFFWDVEHCRRLCKEEGRVSGHCSLKLACWCEGC
uniref:Drosomycin-like n=1 Tax=Drosophila rhopaloa TaxID=1041015 RepID=A0A6P4F548_DRORH